MKNKLFPHHPLPNTEMATKITTFLTNELNKTVTFDSPTVYQHVSHFKYISIYKLKFDAKDIRIVSEFEDIYNRAVKKFKKSSAKTCNEKSAKASNDKYTKTGRRVLKQKTKNIEKYIKTTVKRVKKCNENSSKAADDKYTCNHLTGRWVLKKVTVKCTPTQTTKSLTQSPKCTKKEKRQPKVAPVLVSFHNDQVGTIDLKITNKMIYMTINKDIRGYSMKRGVSANKIVNGEKLVRVFGVLRRHWEYIPEKNIIVFSKSQNTGDEFKTFQIRIPKPKNEDFEKNKKKSERIIGENVLGNTALDIKLEPLN
jgi:hypothetical protein